MYFKDGVNSSRAAELCLPLCSQDTPPKACMPSFLQQPLQRLLLGAEAPAGVQRPRSGRCQPGGLQPPTSPAAAAAVARRSARVRVRGMIVAR